MSTFRSRELMTPVGAAAAGPDSAPPVVDRDVVVAAVAGAVAGGVVAAIAAGRQAPVRTISMGPGGWVSFRGTRPPRRLRTTNGRRPWWAHLLAAREPRRRR